MGNINEIERMILQSKINGADICKLQLYSSELLWGNKDRVYLDIDENELLYIKDYCDKININYQPQPIKKN